MVEVTTSDAARRLGLSQERVSQMLRSGELAGRRISARGWLVDLGSVADRARVATGGGRPWSHARVRAVVEALSSGDATDARTRDLIRSTEVDALWRKVAQQITVRRFSARHPATVEAALVLTGESALEALGEHLVGRSDMAHGYLRGGGLEDVIDEVGLVDDADGRLVIYRLKADDQSWPTGHVAPRALVAVDCARSGTARVHAVGVRTLEDLRRRWLTRNT